MTSLLDVAARRRFTVDGDTISLNENLIADHPYMTSIAAGYLLDKSFKKAAGNQTVDVVTNTFKFYARTPAERRIQQQLVDSLIATKHYRLVRRTQEKGATVWMLRRQPK